MKCIAIDDEPKALAVIEMYCRKSQLVDLRATFREPVKAIAFLATEEIDLVFLDINMPDINGMQLMQALASKPMIIFTTAYSDHAVESYNLNAIDYMLKPITFERFLAAVNKAATLFSLQQKLPAKETVDKTVFIKSGQHTYQVKLADIFYFEKKGNYITLHLKDKQILIRENMNDIFDLVSPDDFVRVHKSFVVAVKHITMIETHQLSINGAKIPIGITFRDHLRSRLGL